MPDFPVDPALPADPAQAPDPDATEIEPAPDPSRRQLRETVRDRASDVLGVARNPLDAFFSPTSVAVVGATEKEGSVGRTIFWNLISSPFGGTVYPVNQKRASILGVRAYPDLAALPEVPELVVIATPASTIQNSTWIPRAFSADPTA